MEDRGCPFWGSCASARGCMIDGRARRGSSDKKTPAARGCMLDTRQRFYSAFCSSFARLHAHEHFEAETDHSTFDVTRRSSQDTDTFDGVEGVEGVWDAYQAQT